MANAYTLPYQGVNMMTFYTGMGSLALGWWFWKLVAYRWKIYLTGVLTMAYCLLLGVAYWCDSVVRYRLFIAS